MTLRLLGQTRRSQSGCTALAMVFKPVETAQRSWRRLDGNVQLPKLISGVKFADGLEVAAQPQGCQLESAADRAHRHQLLAIAPSTFRNVTMPCSYEGFYISPKVPLAVFLEPGHQLFGFLAVGINRRVTTQLAMCSGNGSGRRKSTIITARRSSLLL